MVAPARFKTRDRCSLYLFAVDRPVVCKPSTAGETLHPCPLLFPRAASRRKTARYPMCGQNTECCQLGHDASSRPAMVPTTGTTPNPTPTPKPATMLSLKLRPQGWSDGAAAPLMLGVQVIFGCRPPAHSTSRNGCPDNVCHYHWVVG